jgi:hypothetical protein
LQSDNLILRFDAVCVKDSNPAPKKLLAKDAVCESDSLHAIAHLFLTNSRPGQAHSSFTQD